MNLNKQQLQQKINELVQDLWTVKLGNLLAGWVVSDVYDSKLITPNWEAKNIVIKYTKEDISLWNIFSTADKKDSFSNIPATHDLDIEIQKVLNVKTPKIIKHFPKDCITLMENFTEDWYTLLQSFLLEWKLPENTAENLWKTLAILRNDLEKNWEDFKQIENSIKQFDERFFELKVLLYNWRMDIFNQIEKDFVAKDRKTVIWTDWDQKNFAINSNWENMVFDFGRSIICDPDFMLPNLLWHLWLFSIAWYLKNFTDFAEKCTKSFEEEYLKYNPDYVISTQKYINYFTASLIHRWMAMRWVDPKMADNIGAGALKQACMHFGDIIFDKEDSIKSVDKMYKILEIMSEKAENGEYERVKIEV